MTRQLRPGQLRTGSLYDISSSFALTASYALTGSGFPYSGSAVITGSLLVSGSGITGSLFGTASFATTASYALNVPVTASYALQALSSSFAATASYIDTLYSSNYTQSFSNSSTWTVIHNLESRYVLVQTYDTNYDEMIPQNIDLTDSNTVTISFPTLESGTAVVTVGGALQNPSPQSSSYALTSTSASYALTASHALNVGGASATASYLNTLTQDVTLNGTFYNNAKNIYLDSTATFPFIIGYGPATPNITTNLIVGTAALTQNTTGYNNTIFGHAAMQVNQTGYINTAIGNGALGSNVAGWATTAVGNQAAGGGNVYNSVATGYQALYNGGSNNVAFGYQAGKNASNTSQRNVYLGFRAGTTSSVTESDKLYIHNDYGTPLIGGDFSTRNVTITGNLTVTGSLIVTGSTQSNVVALSISSNTASIDLSRSSFYTLQLVAGTTTFINPSNIRPGVTSTLLISTTGSATVSFPTSVKQPSGSAYIPTTTTSVDILTFISYDESTLYVANVKNMI